MLHVTSWDMAGIGTDAQQWQWRRVQKKHCLRLLVDSCTKKPLDENAPEKNTLISKACIYQNKMAQNPGFRHLEKGI